MNKKYPQNEEEICEFLKTASTIEDFLIAQGLISNFFYGKDSKAIKEVLEKRNSFYILSFENIFNNQNFLKTLDKVLEQWRLFKKNYKGDSFFKTFDDLEIRNKKFILTALITSVSLLSNTLPNLGEKSVIYAAKKLQASIRDIIEFFDQKYSTPEIFYVLSGVFNKKFYSKLKFPFTIKNLDDLFKQQQISSHLVLLSIKLLFRNSSMHFLFKSIERDKLKGKFSSLSVYRISNFIKKERDDEQRMTTILNSLYDKNDFLDNFIENFKDNKNEENAFKLIELTVKGFKSKQTIEEDLLKTIKDASTTLDNIEDHGKKSFKAFSGQVMAGDIEWSNKIFINCCKLFGALKGTSQSLDKNWRIDVCIREFSDWISSVHKILNKYDLDDDWEKISRYLNEETNRIEWKSTFSTPTQITKEDESYSTVSKDMFYRIVKTILGMINTDGGIILIGFVEKPQDIIREDLKAHLLEKHGKVFFNISEELSQSKATLDSIKRKIQDLLKNETLMSVDLFNNLWNIQPVNIKTEDGSKEVTIYKIEILKSEKMFFSIKEDIWISLLKRADARTIHVNPRRYLTS